MDDFREISMGMAKITDADTRKLVKPDELVKEVEFIELPEKQPLKKYGIYFLLSRKTQEIYLFFGGNQKEVEPSISYRGKEMYLIYTASISTKEAPKGRYHGYRFKYNEERWLIFLAYDSITLVESQVPPFPGSYYSREDGKIYYPESIVPAAKEYYPHLEIPDDLILR
jgi:hypothetical protein